MITPVLLFAIDLPLLPIEAHVAQGAPRYGAILFDRTTYTHPANQMHHYAHVGTQRTPFEEAGACIHHRIGIPPQTPGLLVMEWGTLSMATHAMGIALPHTPSMQGALLTRDAIGWVDSDTCAPITLPHPDAPGDPHTRIWPMLWLRPIGSAHALLGAMERTRADLEVLAADLGLAPFGAPTTPAQHMAQE